MPSALHEPISANTSEDDKCLYRRRSWTKRIPIPWRRDQARVTVKLELADDNQKKQGLRRVFHEHPVGARIAALLLLAVVIVGGGLFLRNSLAWESTDDAQVNGHIMPLSARINGYVLEVPVVEGQLVHAGDLLVTIDPKDYKIAMDQAKATFANAQASAASSRFNVPITSVTTQSNLDSAGTAVQTHRRDLMRPSRISSLLRQFWNRRSQFCEE